MRLSSTLRCVSIIVYADNDTVVEAKPPAEDTMVASFDSKSGEPSDTTADPGTIVIMKNEQFFFGTDGIDTFGLVDYILDDVVVEQTGEIAESDLVSDSWQLTYSSKGGVNIDSIDSIERIQFGETNLALDLNVDDNAGMAVALLYSAFNDLPDDGELGFWIDESDALSESNTENQMEALAQSMIDYYAPKGLSNEGLVTLMYQNVIGGTLPEETLQHFVGLIENGTYTQASLVAFAAASEENTSQYESLIATGVTYETDLIY